MKKFLEEFKKFALKGNVFDMAVGIIIGGAFSKIVASLVADVIMPVVGLAFGGVSFTDLKIVIEEAVGDAPEVAIYYGKFIQNTVDFIIIALVVFFMVKNINKLKKKEEVKPPAPAKPTEEVVLLTEIRDLMKSKS